MVTGGPRGLLEEHVRAGGREGPSSGLWSSGPRRRVGTVYLILQLAGGRANEVKTILREVID